MVPEEFQELIGSAVELHSLQAKPELNGSSGVIVGYDPESERFAVRLRGFEDADSTVALKLSNLKPGLPEAAEAGWENMGPLEDGSSSPIATAMPLPPGNMGLAGLDPLDADAHYNFGLMLMQIHDDDQGAEMMYRHCVKVNPRHASAFYNLANLLYIIRGNFLEAEIMYRRAIDLDNAHLAAICNYGTLLKNELDDLEGAILLYGLANKLDPSDSTVSGNCHAARAMEAERRGNWAEAAHLFRTAVKAWQSGSAAEDDPDVVESLGKAKELEQRAAEAEAQRLAAAEEEEDLEDAYADPADASVRRSRTIVPGVSFSEEARVDDVLSKQRSKNPSTSQSAHTILSKVFSSVFKGRNKGKKESSQEEVAIGTMFDGSVSRGRDRTEEFVEQGLHPTLRDPSRSPPPIENDEHAPPIIDRARSSPAPKTNPSSPLFGRLRPSSTHQLPPAIDTTLAPASPEDELAALARGGGDVSASRGRTGGRQHTTHVEGQHGDEVEEDEDEAIDDFAGAGLLDEHAAASEALAVPRQLVTTANGLVANRKYSSALVHYYDALELYDALLAKISEETRSKGGGISEGMSRDLMRDMAKTLNNLAAVLHQLRKFDDAIQAYGRALAIKKASDGEHHFSVGHTLYNMACLHMDHGKHAASADLMRQALAIYELSFGAEHQLTVDVDQQLRGLMQNLEVDGDAETNQGEEKGEEGGEVKGDADGGSTHGTAGQSSNEVEGDLVQNFDAMFHAEEGPDQEFASGGSSMGAHSNVSGDENSNDNASSSNSRSRGVNNSGRGINGGPVPRAKNRPTPVNARNAQQQQAQQRSSSLNVAHARVARATMPHISFGTAI